MTDAATALKTPRAEALLRNLVAGVVVGFIEIIFSISLASLMFSGPLEVQLARGIAIALITSALGMIIPALFGSLESAMAGIQENPTVLLGIAIASIVAGLGVGAEGFATVLAFIFITTLSTGIFLFLLGTFRLGGLMRFIPYPVIGGFMAGTGWLLAQGAISATADYSLSLDTIPLLLQPNQLLLWLPGILFGLILFFGMRRFDHWLTMPALLLGGLLLPFLVFLLAGLSPEGAMERGLLLNLSGDGRAVWQPFPVAEITQANWGVLFSQTSTIGTILILSAVNVLLNVSALEISLRKDIQLNQELRVGGITSIVSALAGGAISYQDLSYTSVGHQIGARGRIAGVTAGLVCLVMMLFGVSLLSYMPKMLLGGLLLFMGLNFLDEWIFQGWKKLGRVDYAVVLLILVIIVLSNFLVGVGVGVILMVARFLLDYSRANIIHHALNGAEASSHVQRSAHYQRELTRLGQHVSIMELQGFIFFGTANAVLEQVRARVYDAEAVRLEYLILDFRRVTGLDSSAMFGLSKVKYLAEAQKFVLVFTHLSDSMQADLARAGLAADEQLHFFADLDHGLEWCEDQLLAASPVTKLRVSSTLAAQLADLGFPKQHVAKFKTYLEQITLAPGDYLIRQGDPFSDLYFIEVGQVSVYLEIEEEKRVRVQTPQMGTIVGELGFYLDAPRTASVIADLNTYAYRLTRAAMERMVADDLELAFAFNNLMLRLIAERLVTTDRVVVALNR
jgi:sulfate permease, SulP family